MTFNVPTLKNVISHEKPQNYTHFFLPERSVLRYSWCNCSGVISVADTNMDKGSVSMMTVFVNITFGQ